MTTIKRAVLFYVNFLVISILSNCVYISQFIPKVPLIIILSVLSLVFINMNIIPCFYNKKIPQKKLRICADGNVLLKLFLSTTAFSIIILFFVALILLLTHYETFFSYKWLFINNSIAVFAVEFIVFWNGIIRLYFTSTQLGARQRILGGICGMIPIIHLLVLAKMIQTVDDEVLIETNKYKINEERKDLQLCKTKYPILMLHGIFFRDFRYFNYWGRIPGELETNGATVFYGNNQSAESIEDSANEIVKRIQEILKETGAEKVNVIAHSKGGLDCRYAISKLGMAPYIASLTTINTPHRGCEFADYLLKKVSPRKQQLIAKTYNNVLTKMGDDHPDFLGGVADLTASRCAKFNEEVLDSDLVYYQSVGSRMNFPSSGRFPVNFTYKFVKTFDGPNDGLVGEKSFKWGSKYQYITTTGKRGVSHADMVDLNRENFDGFDVREFFVQLVSDLKERGF